MELIRDKLKLFVIKSELEEKLEVRRIFIISEDRDVRLFILN